MIDVRSINKALQGTSNPEEVLALTRKTILLVGRSFHPTDPVNPIERAVYNTVAKDRFDDLIKELEACEALCEIFKANPDRTSIETVGDEYEFLPKETISKLVQLVADTVKGIRAAYRI